MFFTPATLVLFADRSSSDRLRFDPTLLKLLVGARKTIRSSRLAGACSPVISSWHSLSRDWAGAALNKLHPRYWGRSFFTCTSAQIRDRIRLYSLQVQHFCVTPLTPKSTILEKLGHSISQDISGLYFTGFLCVFLALVMFPFKLDFILICGLFTDVFAAACHRILFWASCTNPHPHTIFLFRTSTMLSSHIRLLTVLNWPTINAFLNTHNI